MKSTCNQVTTTGTAPTPQAVACHGPIIGVKPCYIFCIGVPPSEYLYILYIRRRIYNMYKYSERLDAYVKIYMDITPIIAPWLQQLLLLPDWPVTHQPIEYINPSLQHKTYTTFLLQLIHLQAQQNVTKLKPVLASFTPSRLKWMEPILQLLGKSTRIKVKKYCDKSYLHDTVQGTNTVGQKKAIHNIMSCNMRLSIVDEFQAVTLGSWFEFLHQWSDWLWRLYPKWPMLCRVRHFEQDINTCYTTSYFLSRTLITFISFFSYGFNFTFNSNTAEK